MGPGWEHGLVFGWVCACLVGCVHVSWCAFPQEQVATNNVEVPSHHLMRKGRLTALRRHHPFSTAVNVLAQAMHNN